MRHPVLKTLKKHLSDRYVIDWGDDMVLHVQLDEESSVIAFLLIDPERPNNVIISMAVDFPDPVITADLCINSGKYSHLLLGEGYYVTDNEEVVWGQAAYESMAMENTNTQMLTDANPFSKAIH